jgi:hypothetical protein
MCTRGLIARKSTKRWPCGLKQTAQGEESGTSCLSAKTGLGEFHALALPLKGEPMQSLVSTKRSESRSNLPSARENLISAWLTRLALNSGVPLDAGSRAVYVQLWMESFADLDDAKLNAAFRKILLTWGSEFGKVGKLPTVGDIRGHIDATANKELASRADLEWQKLLDYIRRFYWADGPWQHKAPKLPEKVRVSCNAAGGFAWLNECSRDDLVWAKKSFIEHYTAWEEMRKDQWLLPEGTLRNLMLEASSEKALLPGPVSDAQDWLPPVVPSQIAPQFTPDVAKQRAATVDMTNAKTITGETMVVKDPNRVVFLKQQAEKMIAKYARD